jgi:dTDP-D-glucose 4,6-dehydratase
VDERNREEMRRVFQTNKPSAVLRLTAESHVDFSFDRSDALLSNECRRDARAVRGYLWTLGTERHVGR